MTAGAPPVWLADEPEIQALLSAVLDRFDKQSGEARQNVIPMKVERYLTTLSRGDAQADQLWAFIVELFTQGILTIRPGRRGAYDPQWKDAKLAFSPTIEPTLREWLSRPASPSQTLLWRQAVEKFAGRFPAGRDLLLSKRIVVAGRSAEEVVAALASLAQVQRAVTLRQLSTFAFWGNSKLLDDRADLIAALFPQIEVRDRPLVVAAYLPDRIDGVLFIENLDTYSAAIEGEPAAVRNHALVYMAGFKGAALRIRSRHGARLHLAGPGHDRFASQLDGWWFDGADAPGPLRFWGDLDFAGMQILKALRQRFDTVDAWRPGYEPMLADLLTTPPIDIAMTLPQIDPVTTGSQYADEVLLPAIRRHGFWDQERIGAE